MLFRGYSYKISYTGRYNWSSDYYQCTGMLGMDWYDLIVMMLYYFWLLVKFNIILSFLLPPSFISFLLSLASFSPPSPSFPFSSSVWLACLKVKIQLSFKCILAIVKPCLLLPYCLVSAILSIIECYV